MRQRIVAATAERILQRGLGGTRLDDVRTDTLTSKSQLFHYFPGGKLELTREVVAWQGERLYQAQQPAIDDLSTWESWEAWQACILQFYRSLKEYGCPIGSLTAESIAVDPILAQQISTAVRQWRRQIAAGVRRLQKARLLSKKVDADVTSASILAAIQGGAMMNVTEKAYWPLEAALAQSLAALRAHAIGARTPL